MRPKPVLAMAGALTLALVGTAFAESDDDEREGEREAQAVVAAPVTLGQAISTAEGSTGGRAVRASYETQNGTSVVRVDLVKDKARLEAHVDANSGKVIATNNLEEDDDGGNDEGSEEDEGDEEEE